MDEYTRDDILNHIHRFGIDCGTSADFVDVAKDVIERLEGFGYHLGFDEEDIKNYRFVYVSDSSRVHMYKYPGYQEEEITADEFFCAIDWQESFDCGNLSELYEWIA